MEPEDGKSEVAPGEMSFCSAANSKMGNDAGHHRGWLQEIVVF